MLFFYKSLDQAHKIELLNSYYDHFFTKLFTACNSSVNLLIHSDFLHIYSAHQETIKRKLDEIYRIYLSLSNCEKVKVKLAFDRNRKIYDICNCTVRPMKYEELNIKIRSILKALYNESWKLLTNSSEDQNINIKNICGNIYEHYRSLFKNQRQGFTICPVCGLESLLSDHDASAESDGRAREAYDHYLPQSLYPFISINFSNLFPICHHCNSDYKKSCDPVYDNDIQKKSFYPFVNSNTINSNDIEIKINKVDTQSSQNLSECDDWEIELSSPSDNSEQISSWNRIFKIKSRYKARIKTKESGWKKRLVEKFRTAIRDGGNISIIKEDLYDDINITDQTDAIVQRAYYDYFYRNLLDSYLEEANIG